MAGGSASALPLSRPAQALRVLRPVGSLSHPRWPLSRGFSPVSCLAKPLVRCFLDLSTIILVESSSTGDSRLQGAQSIPGMERRDRPSVKPSPIPAIADGFDDATRESFRVVHSKRRRLVGPAARQNASKQTSTDGLCRCASLPCPAPRYARLNPSTWWGDHAVPKLQRRPERRQQVLRAMRLGTSTRLPNLWACQFSSGSVLFRVWGWPRSKQAGDGTVERPSSNRAGQSGLLG
jgi:hypothetical protein